jgi:DeoR-like helix-turn-helix domain
MFAAERHQYVINAAKSAGRVEVSALAAALAVTTETIRRDLPIASILVVRPNTAIVFVGGRWLLPVGPFCSPITRGLVWTIWFASVNSGTSTP